MPLAQSSGPMQNRILASLPSKQYKDFLANRQSVSLKLSQVLYEAGEPIRHVYFPNSAMISLIATREGGSRTVEVGVVGAEGMLGTTAFLGNPVALNKALVQRGHGAASQGSSAARRGGGWRSFARVVARLHTGSARSDYSLGRLQPIPRSEATIGALAPDHPRSCEIR